MALQGLTRGWLPTWMAGGRPRSAGVMLSHEEGTICAETAVSGMLTV